MFSSPADRALPDIVLASIRQPGDAACSNIHVRDGLVSRITAADELPRGARVVDFGARFLIPGLWDEHVHMTQWALAANRIDLSGAASARAAVELVRNRMTAAEPQTGRTASAVTVGAGFRDAVWGDVPSAEMLDDATGGVPAALISHDLHCVWLNSAAARRYGVELPADGLLREEPAFAVTRELGKLPDGVVDGWVRTA